MYIYVCILHKFIKAPIPRQPGLDRTDSSNEGQPAKRYGRTEKK